jgi:hypothetical protein
MSEPATGRDIRDNACEIKFLVSHDTAERLRERARALLAPDPWASGSHADQYTTTTLYFDTEKYLVFNRQGSFRRAKYRIRRYGAGDAAFLERKLRTSELLSKRRTLVRLDELAFLTTAVADEHWCGRWFHQRLLMRKLRAVTQVTYDRTARVAMTDYGVIRLTIDEGLKALPVDLPEFVPDGPATPLPVEAIIEMKYRAEMPAVFRRLAEEFGLQAQRVSKYRLGVTTARPEVAHAGSATATDGDHA